MPIPDPVQRPWVPNPVFVAAVEARAVERHEDHDDCTDVETDDAGDVVDCSCTPTGARHCEVWEGHLYAAGEELGAAWRRQEDRAREEARGR